MDAPLWQTIGKWLLGFGVFTALIGGALWLLGPWLSELGLGSMPGDFRGEVGDVQIFFPLATMIVLSIVLTVAVNLVLWFLRVQG